MIVWCSINVKYNEESISTFEKKDIIIIIKEWQLWNFIRRLNVENILYLL